MESDLQRANIDNNYLDVFLLSGVLGLGLCIIAWWSCSDCSLLRRLRRDKTQTPRYRTLSHRYARCRRKPGLPGL